MNDKLDIGICITEAWRGFKGWWIPLCIIAAIILFSQSWLPQWLLSDSFTKLEPYQITMEVKQSVMSGDMTVLEAFTAINTAFAELFSDPIQTQELAREIKNLLLRACVVIAVLLVPIAFMLLLMIIFSKASVQTRKEDITLKRDISRSILMSFSYIFLALLKMSAFALWVIPIMIIGFGKPDSKPVILLLLFLLLFLMMVSAVLGPWVYVKLFFTGFIINSILKILIMLIFIISGIVFVTTITYTICIYGISIVG